MQKDIRISLLWLAIVLGYLVYIADRLMPIIWGEDVISPEATGTMPMIELLLTVLVIFIIPLVAVLFIAYFKGKGSRILNFTLACINMLMTILNLFDMLTGVPEIIIMAAVFFVSILLVADSYIFMKSAEA